MYVGLSRKKISHRFPISSMKNSVILGTLKSHVMSWDPKPAKQDGIKSHWVGSPNRVILGQVYFFLSKVNNLFSLDDQFSSVQFSRSVVSNSL